MRRNKKLPFFQRGILYRHLLQTILIIDQMFLVSILEIKSGCATKTIHLKKKQCYYKLDILTKHSLMNFIRFRKCCEENGFVLKGKNVLQRIVLSDLLIVQSPFTWIKMSQWQQKCLLGSSCLKSMKNLLEHITECCQRQLWCHLAHATSNIDATDSVHGCQQRLIADQKYYFCV